MLVDDCRLDEEIDATSHREAYEKFLDNQGTHNSPVYVTSGFWGSGKVFNDHIEKTRKELADSQAIAIKQTATEDAEASLTPTDMLLKQLLVEQKRSNELLEKLRRIALSFWWWFIGSVLIVIAVSLLGRGCKAVMG